MNARLRRLIGAPAHAYDRYFADRGEFAAIPSKRISYVEVHRGKEFVVFRNVNGIVGIYQVGAEGSLAEIDYWTDPETDRVHLASEETELMIRSDGRWIPAERGAAHVR